MTISGIFISTLATQIIHESLESSHPSSHSLVQITLLEETIQPIVAFMVLCSIAVHRLSIPSFSLGRRVHSVSRTWSRHASIPDWTNQAMVISAPEDIIINRDRSDEDLERGMGMKEKSDRSTAVLGDGEDLGEKGVREKRGRGRGGEQR